MFLNRSRLRRRVVDIAYRRRLSHLSSCLTSVGILCDIYGNWLVVAADARHVSG